jgi:hypothetical protein
LRSAEVEIVKSKSSENEAGAANNTFQFREENKCVVLLMSISEIFANILSDVTQSFRIVFHDRSDVDIKVAFFKDLLVFEFKVRNIVGNHSN